MFPRKQPSGAQNRKRKENQQEITESLQRSLERFSLEAVNWLIMKGLVGWFLQVLLLKMSLFTLGGAESPLLDIVAYAGYGFTGFCLAFFGKILMSYSCYFLIPWTCLCMGIFLVKTMKRVLFSEVRNFNSTRHHYLLLFITLAQLPLLIWFGIRKYHSQLA